MRLLSACVWAALALAFFACTFGAVAIGTYLALDGHKYGIALAVTGAFILMASMAYAFLEEKQ